MKESIARTRWCPMVRIPPENTKIAGPAANRNKGDHGLCIASDCALWVEDGSATAEFTEHGHCGLIKC